MHIYARQGDLVIEKLSAPIAGELEAVKRIVFAGDSSGHPHVMVASRTTGKISTRKEGRRTLLRVEGNGIDMQHGKPEGHGDVPFVPGDYAIYPLRERGDGSDRSVED